MDLLAVGEAAGEGAVAIAIGDGFNRTARAAAARPDLISHVVAVVPAAAAVLPRSELKGSGVLAASESVVEMVLQMMNTEPRAALRTLIAAINPELDEDHSANASTLRLHMVRRRRQLIGRPPGYGTT